MNFERVSDHVKKESIIRDALGDSLGGVEIIDKMIKSITLKADGKTIRLKHNDYSGIEVLVPEEPAKVTKYRLTGGGGLCVDKTFDDQYDAEKAREKLEMDLNIPYGTLKVTEFEEVFQPTAEEDILF